MTLIGALILPFVIGILLNECAALPGDSKKKRMLEGTTSTWQDVANNLKERSRQLRERN